MAAGTAKAGRLLQVMFGKHVIGWPRGCLITGLYRDRGWVIGSSLAAGDHTGHRS